MTTSLARFGGYAVALGMLVLSSYCSTGGDRDLALTIAAERGDSESSKPFMTLTVIAENLGDSRVTWGNGSSACQFDLIVDVDGTEHSISRICTADYVEHGLDPDETRIEELRWDGTILVAGELKALPPGTYPVRAVAGDATSPTISVNIEAIR